MDEITSRDNPQVKQLVGLLTRKKERDQSGLFALEGVRLCVDGAQSGLDISVLLLTPQAAERYPETQLLREQAERVLWLNEDLAARIGDTKTPQGVYAICKKLDNAVSAVKIKSTGHYLLVSSLQDPGNVGSVLRTAEAMGVDGVYLSGDCPDLYSPKVLRGSMGGVFRLPVAVVGDLLAEITALQEAGVPVYAAALGEQAQIAGEIDFSGGGAVVVGNEGGGLTQSILDVCTSNILIPMGEEANSLGAAMAAGILLWEMRRTRQNPAGSR